MKTSWAIKEMKTETTMRYLYNVYSGYNKKNLKIQYLVLKKMDKLIGLWTCKASLENRMVFS